jgi:hypothetical protein
MIVRIEKAEPDQEKYCYSPQSKEDMIRCGCIGYIQGDFGWEDTEFNTSWYDLNPKLRTKEFKADINDMVNSLRIDPVYGRVLYSRYLMRKFCEQSSDNGFLTSLMGEYMFRIDTDNYVYMMRCNPSPIEHNFTIYSYNAKMFQERLSAEVKTDTAKIDVIIVKPGQKPYIANIPNSLAAIKDIVDGYIEVVYPFDDSAVIICNEDSKFNDMPLNRPIYDEDGKINDIICGNFIIAGVDGSDFTSLTNEQKKRYIQMYSNPERFVNIDGTWVLVKGPVNG